MKRLLLPTLFVVALAACSKQAPTDPAPAPAAPEPAAPAPDEAPEPSAEAEDPPATPEPSTGQPKGEAEDGPAAEAARAAKPTTEAKAEPAPKPERKPEATAKSEPKAPTKTEAKAPTKAEPEKPEPEKPAAHTRIPSSKHVKVDVPAKLQALLDGDSRMQGWIDKVMGVAEQCYAQVRGQNAEAGGTLVVKVTMHENSRPSPDIKTLPPALSNLVACSTGRLFNVRMPLFTGPEGQKHTVKLHFTP